MIDAKMTTINPKQYSEQYNNIRKEAESRWPAWKVSTYNANIAISANARKIKSN